MSQLQIEQGAGNARLADRVPSRTDLIGRCFRKFFKGWGRASRREFWSFFFFVAALIIAAIYLELEVFDSDDAAVSDFFVFAFMAVIFGLGPPLFFVGMRRYHDLGHSGWLYLLHVLTGFGTFFMLFAAFGKSQPYDNKHGPVPPEAKR